MKTVTTRVTAFVFWLRRQDLNLQRPSCGSQNFAVPWSGTKILTATPRQHKLRLSFSLRKSSPLRCASSSPKSLSGFSGTPLSPSSATGGGLALCPGNPSVAGHKLKKYPPFGEYLKLVAETGFEPATSGL